MSTIYIILGAIFIAFGGYLATYGWNLKSSIELKKSLQRSRFEEIVLQREEIIKAIFLEVATNLLMLDNRQFTETNKEELSKYVIYPRFRTEALASGLSSSLFLDKKYRSLYFSISGLLANFNDTNNRLDRIQDSMRRLTKSPEGMTKARIAVRDGIYREDLRNKIHNFIGTIMMSQYRDIALCWISTELNGETKSFFQKEYSEKIKTSDGSNVSNKP